MAVGCTAVTRRLWGVSSISVGAPVWGEHGWAFLSWGLPIRGIFIRSFRDMQNCKMPCRRESLSIGAPLGNLEGVVCRDF
jgi:hypothetical protein